MVAGHCGSSLTTSAGRDRTPAISRRNAREVSSPTTTRTAISTPRRLARGQDGYSDPLFLSDFLAFPVAFTHTLSLSEGCPRGGGHPKGRTPGAACHRAEATSGRPCADEGVCGRSWRGLSLVRDILGRGH